MVKSATALSLFGVAFCACVRCVPSVVFLKSMRGWEAAREPTMREKLNKRWIDPAVLAQLESELLDMREQNLRSEALLHLARALKAERWVTILKAFCTMHLAWGWLPPGGDEIQREALTELVGCAECRWGADAAARIRESF